MGQAASQAAVGASDSLSMSPDARKRMRRREVDVFAYYDDMGSGKGNCTWGPGILAGRVRRTNLAKQSARLKSMPSFPGGWQKQNGSCVAMSLPKHSIRRSSMPW